MVRKDGTVIIIPADSKLKIEGDIRYVHPGTQITVGEIKVQAVEAYNYKRFRSEGVPFHPKGFGVGYLITIEDKTIYHAGDTDFIPEMSDLKNIYLALIPTGGTYTMDNPEAAAAILTIQPEIVIPMHLWDTDPNKFKAYVEAKTRTKVIILKPGQQFETK